MTKTALRETIVAGDLDHFPVVVDSLAQEFDIVRHQDVAAEAVKMVEARDGVEAKEIPSVTIRPDRPASQHERGPAPKFGGAKGDASKAVGKGFGGKNRITPKWDVARLYTGAGRAANVRAGDPVGPIVNEAGLDARAIGAIQITTVSPCWRFRRISPTASSKPSAPPPSRGSACWCGAIANWPRRTEPRFQGRIRVIPANPPKGGKRRDADHQATQDSARRMNDAAAEGSFLASHLCSTGWAQPEQ